MAFQIEVQNQSLPQLDIWQIVLDKRPLKLLRNYCKFET
jgi:hypothetical protein